MGQQGVQAGDVIQEIDGEAASLYTWSSLVDRLTDGLEVSLKLARGGQTRELSVRLRLSDVPQHYQLSWRGGSAPEAMAQWLRTRQ